MNFEHKIPKIYYSHPEDISHERENLEIHTIKKRFPEYEILSSKNMFNNDDEWSGLIDSTIEDIDIVIFSCPNECKEGFYFSEKYDHELNLTIKKKKVVCIVSGNKIKSLSDNKWVNTAIQSIKQRR